MLFLSPLLLWFLAAASVPVAIHLINRRRHKTIQWAAMRFLLKATRESRGKKKLRHILILTCRTLAIVALALAAARPVISGLTGWGGGSIDTLVLLLDRSASMEIRPGDGLESRRQIVLEKVRDAIGDLNPARLVLIDSASGNPQEIPSPDVLTELSATAATDSGADFSAMLARAAEFLTETQGRSEVWLVSDLQRASWRPEDERWHSARAALLALPQKPALRVLSITGPTAANASVSLLSSRRMGGELLLDLEIQRSGEARGTSTIPLTTRINGGTTTDSLTVPGQSLRFQKRIPLPPDTESGNGWVSIPADGNPRDNVAFFAFGPARAAKSLIVAPQGESADYLALAAAPPGYDGYETRRVDPTAAGASITPDLAAILWAAPFPEGEMAGKLQEYLTSGGHVLFLPPGTASTTPFFDITWSDPADAPAGKFFILGDWNRADGPLRDGIDGTPVAGDRLKAIRRQIPLGEATPLARWEDGEPALIRRIFDHGTAWLLGTTPDYTWSNLGDADVLLPLVQRIIATAADRFDASHLATVGSPAARLLAGETRRRVDDYGTPDPANTEFEAGIHQLGERVIAINRPPAEDSPEVLARETLDAVLDGTGYTLLDQAGQATDSTLSRDVWRAFLIGTLFFLISEALLCLPRKPSDEPVVRPAAA
ncbi:MAG TPA: BatA and WFA domain-containing protein [Luteolibacter sp.]|nr:BatA and WFA domain-containing protein [Luteolibacter sp.]